VSDATGDDEGAIKSMSNFDVKSKKTQIDNEASHKEGDGSVTSGGLEETGSRILPQRTRDNKLKK